MTCDTLGSVEASMCAPVVLWVRRGDKIDTFKVTKRRKKTRDSKHARVIGHSYLDHGERTQWGWRLLSN